MKRIGIELWGIYDGIAFWQVGDYAWHRWPVGSGVRERVEAWAAKNHVAIHDAPPDGLEAE